VRCLRRAGEASPPYEAPASVQGPEHASRGRGSLHFGRDDGSVRFHFREGWKVNGPCVSAAALKMDGLILDRRTRSATQNRTPGGPSPSRRNMRDRLCRFWERLSERPRSEKISIFMPARVAAGPWQTATKIERSLRLPAPNPFASAPLRYT
jgi:hypothetical protein